MFVNCGPIKKSFPNQNSMKTLFFCLFQKFYLFSLNPNKKLFKKMKRRLNFD